MWTGVAIYIGERHLNLVSITEFCLWTMLPPCLPTLEKKRNSLNIYAEEEKVAITLNMKPVIIRTLDIWR